jgi:hypothetical protein
MENKVVAASQDAVREEKCYGYENAKGVCV